MLLKIAAFVMVILITFFQSITGMFSAMIMFVLSVACAGLAFGTYDMLHAAFLQQYIPEYGHAVALVGVFVITLGITRLAADQFIKRNMEFPGIIDRLGAVVFGFCSAMILTGVLAIGIQLLPFDRDILGFNRMVKVDQETGEEITSTSPAGGTPGSFRYASSGLWLSPDGFVVNLVSVLSSYSFSGSVSFAEAHPDYLNELQMVRCGSQKESRHAVPTDIISVQAVWQLDDDQLEDGDRTRRAPGDQWLCVRTRLKNAQEALDSDKKQRFTPMQVRLVCRESNEENAKTRQYTPIGIALNVMEDTVYGDHRRVHPEQPVMLPGGSGHVLDFVFEVPESCVPWLLAYKRGARVEIPQRILAAGRPKAKIIEAITEAPEAEAAEDLDSDRVPGVHVRSGQSRFDRKLPVAMEPDWLAGTEMDLSKNRFRRGHAVAEWPTFEAEPSVALKYFFVPPGRRLFQLSVARQEAKSIFGRALQFARTTLKQYVVRDEQGDTYFRIGEIRIAKVGGQEKLEIQYWPQTEIPERCIREPKAIKDSNLTDDYTLIYLYLIPQDRTPVEFDIGNRIRKLQ